MAWTKGAPLAFSPSKYAALYLAMGFNPGELLARGPLGNYEHTRPG